MVENAIDTFFQKNIVTNCELLAVSKCSKLENYLLCLSMQTVRTKVTFVLAVCFVSSLKVYFVLKISQTSSKNEHYKRN